SVAPQASYQDVRSAILNNVDPVPSLAGKTVTGGRLNALNTLVSLKGGISVATGDVNGDGVADIIVRSGNTSSRVKGYDGQTGAILYNFLAYPWAPDVGITVAVGDIDGDGKADIITGSANYSSHVLVFSGANGSMIRSFLAYPWADPGITVAAGDIDGD